MCRHGHAHVLRHCELCKIDCRRGSLRGSLRGRVSEVFRGFERFSEVFRGFSKTLSETSQSAIFLSELRVLLPLIVLPLKTPIILAIVDARAMQQSVFSFVMAVTPSKDLQAVFFYICSLGSCSSISRSSRPNSTCRHQPAVFVRRGRLCDKTCARWRCRTQAHCDIEKNWEWNARPQCSSWKISLPSNKILLKFPSAAAGVPASCLSRSRQDKNFNAALAKMMLWVMGLGARWSVALCNPGLGTDACGNSLVNGCPTVGHGEG